jgi:hypothetical protein
MGNGNCWVTPVGKIRKLSEALFRSKTECMGRHLICISLSNSMDATEDNILQIIICMTKKKVGLMVTTGHGLT